MAYQPRIVNLGGNTTYHDEVRAHLGVSVGALPDTDIDAPSSLQRAEALVVARVPNYSSLVNDDQAYVYSAAVLLIAAYLAPSMGARLKASEGDSDYKYSNQNVDWAERKKDLESEAYGLMDLISTQTTVELPQILANGPTTYQQQQNIAQGGSNAVFPDSGDMWMYPETE